MRSCAAAGAAASSVQQSNITVRPRMMSDPLKLPLLRFFRREFAECYALSHSTSTASARRSPRDFGALSVVSVYLPSGSSSEERQQAKFRFLDEFMPVLKGLRAGGREFVLCGDWNIAHKEIDLENWRGNRKNSGFLPEERAWLSETFDGVGWVDVFRKVDPRPRQYTWWSNRGQAWKKNVGWRIDYHIATPGIAAKARKARIS